MHHTPTINASSKPVITVLGSERVHRPLKLVATRSSFQIRAGGFAMSEQSSRLAVARLKTLAEREDRFEVSPAHLLFVEISCSTVLYHGAQPVGTDWLKTHFPSLMSQHSLAKQVWRLAALPSLEERRAAIEKYKAFGTTLTPEGKAKLAAVSLRRLNHEDMLADISQIQKLWGDPIIVTPCPALKSSGRPLYYRERLIADVTEIAKGLEIRHFDPTFLVKRFGQNLAFEPKIDGLNSYTEGFVRMVAAYLGKHYLADLTGNTNGLIPGIKAPAQAALAASGGN